MDDFPASAVGSKPPRPPLTVVLPVKNGGRDFEQCLVRLRASTFQDFELIVVDDASTDDSVAIAERFGARVFRHAVTTGPAAARNDGALAATAPIIFFLDADVAIHEDAIALAMSRFAIRPDLAALFGSYDDTPTAPGLVSQFRNLLHHFVHQQGSFHDEARPARTFWTGIGAIRRGVFLDRGGFDPRRYRRPAIEDIELGYRVSQSGGSIELCRDIQGTHLKRWSLGSMIKTDILCRGVPWLLLMKRTAVAESDLNVKNTQKLCVVFAGLGTLCGLAAIVFPLLVLGVIICLATVVFLNRDFYRFLTKRKGIAFAAGSLALHIIYYYCCAVSVIIAETAWRVGGLKHQTLGNLDALDHRLRIDTAMDGLISRPQNTAPTRSSKRTESR